VSTILINDGNIFRIRKRIHEERNYIKNVYISDGYAFIADGESLLIVAVSR